jgi:hypothetical protein
MSWLHVADGALGGYALAKVFEGDETQADVELQTARNELARAESFFDDAEDEERDEENRAEDAERAVEHADVAISIASRHSPNESIPTKAKKVRSGAQSILKELGE